MAKSSDLGFLTWLGSMTASSLVHIFHHSAASQPGRVTLWSTLATVLLSEHVYFAAQRLLRALLDHVESRGKQKERHERYLVRRTYLERMGVDSKQMDATLATNQKNHERQELGGFWQRQKDATHTISAGVEIIRDAATAKAGKKTQ